MYRIRVGDSDCTIILTLFLLLYRSLGQTTRKDVQALQQQFAATRSDMVALQKAEIRSKIAEWLAAPDPSSNFELARRKHEAATSTWFTQGSQFLHWMDQNSSFYWLYGLRKSI